MTAVVFETPGLMDVRSITIVGAHAKPNSTNPIGYFGTGLKNAIAILVRLGAEPVIWIGRDRFSFATYATTFRGHPLETIKMKVLKDGAKRPRYFELPYTTRYGVTWELWMAFRELESNTRDEGGKTFLIDSPDKWDLFNGGPDPAKTYIVIDLPAFTEVAEGIDSIFLPRARREGKMLDAIPADEDGCPFLYYRTMRAKTLGKPSIYTYNVVELMTLTEDRQLAYEFQVRDILAKWVLTEASEIQIERIITADEDWWEHGLEFPAHVQPSAAFRAVMMRKPKGISRYASGYWSGYVSPPRRVKHVYSLFASHPKPWKLSGDFVFDALSAPIFERPDHATSYEWESAAEAIITAVGAMARFEEPEPEEAPVPDPAEPLEPEDTDPLLTMLSHDAPCPEPDESAEVQGEDWPF